MSPEQSVPRSGFTLFAVGAALGAGVALLYAPRSGKETRKFLATKATQLRDKAQVNVEKAQGFIKDGKADFAAAFDSGNEIAGHKRT